MGRCKYTNIYTLLTLVDFITYFITKYPLYIKRSLAITRHWVDTITDLVEWTGRISQVGSFFCCFSTDVHMYNTYTHHFPYDTALFFLLIVIRFVLVFTF